VLSKIIKAVFALAATLLALALVVAASLGVWVMTGPKTLTNLVPYIENSMNNEEAPYRVEIGDVVVSWQGLAEPLDLRLKDVTIFPREENTRLMKLGEMSVGLHIPSLLRLKAVPESIILRRPLVLFYRNAEGELLVGIGSHDNRRIPVRELVEGMKRKDGDKADSEALIGNIRYIAIQNARIIFGESGDADVFDADDANLRFSRAGDEIIAAVDISFQHGEEKNAYLRGDMRVGGDEDMMVAKFELRDFSPHVFAKLFPNQPALSALKLPFSGWMDVALDARGQVSLIDYRLQGGEGTFTLEEHFAEPLNIKAARLEGQIRDDFRQFMLKKGELELGGAKLTVNGIANRHPEGWTADIAALAENMPVNDLYKYWPKSISPTSYEWVTTHIREGNVPRAEARVKLTEEHLGQPFPEEALDVEIHAEGVEVNYLDGYPKVQDVKGVVEFSGKGMTITSQQGRMLSGGVLKDAWLQIPELMAAPAPMHIKLKVEAPARDVAIYVGIPALNFAEPLGLDPQTIQGNATGDMQFDFVLQRKDSEDRDPHLAFVIDADITNGVQPGFMGNKDLSDVNGKLHITEQRLKYDGKMSISAAPLDVAVTHEFKPQGTFQTEYTAKGRMSLEQLKVFGVPELPFATGVVGLDAHIRRNQTLHNLNVNADLAAVAIDMPQIGLKKPEGKPAKLQFEADAAEDSTALKSFSLEGDELYLSGAANMGKTPQDLSYLQMDRIEFNDNNFNLKLSRKDSGRYDIVAKGPSLDLTPLFAKDDQPAPAEEEAQKSNDYPFAFNMQGNFDWVIFGKERELRNVSANANCEKTHCEQVNVNGLTGQDNRFSFNISRRADATRRMDFRAENAGSFLKAVNLYDSMVGGTISANGSFDDNIQARPFTGKLTISEHTIVNAPVLAKMATLLSLSGIGDALQGKGIAFKELTSEIGYVNDSLTLREGRSYGPSLGITVEQGVIDLRGKRVAVNGTVVPSYTLNTVLNNIPVIGEALSGGKGEGVFAATYKVEGTYPENVDVSVNPLSMLAPGFLRNVFGGGAAEMPEKPAAEEVPAEAETKEAAEEEPAAAPESSEVEEVVTPPSQ
jgi:hypothetical protein